MNVVRRLFLCITLIAACGVGFLAPAAIAQQLDFRNAVSFQEFISRWTNAEYAAFLQARAAAIQAGNVALVRQWDMASAAGIIFLGRPAATNFKAALVSASILTQVRADAIFAAP